MKDWSVRIHRQEGSITVGQVTERNEALARCAALARYGVSEEEIAAGEVGAKDSAIYPDDEFGVVPAA
ncbi:hypothetical protein [Ottowia sp.]|uniref:hypothetical protein n=1 Tax=Ottowia sp. TaxID=1898956 RepID=UPI00262A0846|nr:hypothetical protein [Ottowia sp.]